MTHATDVVVAAFPVLAGSAAVGVLLLALLGFVMLAMWEQP